MAYVSVPRDLSKVKTKILFNLTKRQLLCFGGGALIGTPVFFLLKRPCGVSTAALVMVLIMLPCFLLAMYERNGQPLEKVVGNILRTSFLHPRKRPYMTQNLYTALERQTQLDREVYHIVKGTDPGTAKTDRRRHPKSQTDR